MRSLYIILFIVCFFCVGCYRMPNEDEVSLIPNTNNPSIAKPPGSQMLMPPLNPQ